MHVESKLGHTPVLAAVVLSATVALSASMALATAVPSTRPTSHGQDRATDPPRLLVVLVVDQMRADYLDRFSPQFTGGFARLLSDGANFTETHQDHAATVTAVGHATISTGVYPSRHAIVGNDFLERTEDRDVYNSLDESAPILGYPDEPGRSPRRLRRDGLGDWLKRASPASKVYSVAIKDRAAIMMADQAPDGVFWYLGSSGTFVTSSYYAAAYPAWVDSFNTSGLVDSYFTRGWTRLLPEDQYGASREDSFPAEAGGRWFTFPYNFSERFDNGTGRPNRSYYSFLRRTPFGDEITLEFAKEMVRNERLGVDDAPDILFVGASAGDYIGHRWGPYSQEIQDHYLRLDGYLGQFFSFLDETVGAENYAVALTADHGVAAAPEEMVRRGQDARRIQGSVFREAILGAITGAMAELGIREQPGVRYMEGLIFEASDSGETAVPVSGLSEAVAARLREVDIISSAFSAEDVSRADADGESVVSMFRRSYHPERSPDVMLNMKPHYLLGGDIAQHGSAHRYDTHVPLIFNGPGFVSGWHSGRVRTVDIAPTLGALLGIEVPDDLDGQALEAAFRGEDP
jgi:predicted AlkP superfamily pyrophosphatase or phosphodiesterase